jgi:hypothetical protein
MSNQMLAASGWLMTTHCELKPLVCSTNFSTRDGVSERKDGIADVLIANQATADTVSQGRHSILAHLVHSIQ